MNTVFDYLSKKNDEVENILSDVEKLYNECREKQGILDKLKNDIEHEIELDKMDAVAMVKKFKEYQSVLKLRRKYKDNVAMLRSYRSKFSLKKLNNVRNSVKQINTNQQCRGYKYRVKSEVRDEILEEINSIDRE